MASGNNVSGEDTVGLAVCVGWRMAELYDKADLAGPPHHESAGVLPAHLPGFGEMSEHEKACALTAHIGADLGSLGRALDLWEMPSAWPVLDALLVPGHRRDDVRAVIFELYVKIRDLVAGSNVSVALGLGLGRMLADTTLLPNEDHLDTLEERFKEYRLANAYKWLNDLDARLPAHSAAVVRATLADWEQWVAGLPRIPNGGIDPAGVDKEALQALQRQGDIWRRLLTGEQHPDQLLDRQAYIGAATKLLAAVWRIGVHFLWKWSWSIILVAGAFGAGIWAAYTYAPGETSRVAAVVASVAGFLGISWLSARATLGRALRQAERALWEVEVTAAIAKMASTVPKRR